MTSDFQIISTKTPAYREEEIKLSESDRCIKNVCTILCPQTNTLKSFCCNISCNS